VVLSLPKYDAMWRIRTMLLKQTGIEILLWMPPFLWSISLNSIHLQPTSHVELSLIGSQFVLAFLIVMLRENVSCQLPCWNISWIVQFRCSVLWYNAGYRNYSVLPSQLSSQNLVFDIVLPCGALLSNLSWYFQPFLVCEILYTLVPCLLHGCISYWYSPEPAYVALLFVLLCVGHSCCLYLLYVAHVDFLCWFLLMVCCLLLVASVEL
jgi:hypothetical protein